VIIGIEHLIMFIMMQFKTPEYVFWGIRALPFSLKGLVFWLNRLQRLLPTSSVERQLWSIWVGYLIACLGMVIAGRQILDDFDPYKLTLTLFRSLLSGLAFFAMGGSYWGRCYALGARERLREG
jgi:hypothetical protein